MVQHRCMLYANKSRVHSCRTHARGMPVAPQGSTNVEGWSATEVKRSKELRVEISTLLCQYTKEYWLGHIHAAMPT